MGVEGARLTEQVTERAAALVGEWAPIGEVTRRAMFGGQGIFVDGSMFAIVDSAGRLYLKADDERASVHEEVGGERHGRMPYWSVPDDVLDDEAALRDWAAAAAAVARR